jgi:hypothetical protein
MRLALGGFVRRSELCWRAKKIALFSAPAAMGVNCCIPVHFAGAAIAGCPVSGYNSQPIQVLPSVFVWCKDFDLVGNIRRWAVAHFFFVESF